MSQIQSIIKNIQNIMRKDAGVDGDRLDSLSEKMKKIKNLQSATQNDFTALEQSVLSKAFY